ncbi:MAG: MerR family DNA-binding transcriptional regulator [Ktedonobacteraceae bacterium]
MLSMKEKINMREHMHLKIGEFARVGQVSIATLRYYDQCGLLKPNSLNPCASYRYNSRSAFMLELALLHLRNSISPFLCHSLKQLQFLAIDPWIED